MSATSPHFETHLAPSMSDAEKTRRDALLMLDGMEDYGATHDQMIAELSFNFGYTAAEAKRIHQTWSKQV